MSGVIVRIDQVILPEILQTAVGLKGYSKVETKEVETVEGEKRKFRLFTSVDELTRDDFGIKISVSSDELLPFRHRFGVDWARNTRKFRLRIFNDGYVIFYAPKREVPSLVTIFERDIFQKRGMFRSCTIPPEEMKAVVDNPKLLEVRASRFRDFILSNVYAGSLHGFHLERTPEFADFKDRSKVKGLMVRMATTYGPITALLTEDCTFVLYSKVEPNLAENIFEGLTRSIVLPMIK